MTAPTLSVDYSGNTFVKVSFDEYLPGTETVVVQRISDGRTWEARGGLNIATGVGVTDFEAPFGVPSRYRGQCFDATGAPLGFTDEAEITVWDDRTIIHQPLDPSIWVSVTDMAGTAVELVKPSPGENVWVEGAPYARRIGGVRRGLEGFRYQFDTLSIEDADMVQRLTGIPDEPFPAVVCVRMPPPVRIPRTLFVTVEQLVEVDKDVRYGRERVGFELEGDECEPPYVGLVKPLLSYDDLDAAFGSYDLLDAAYASYADRDQAYELAGTA